MRRLQLQQQLFIVLLLLVFFPRLLTSSAQNNWRRKRVLNIKDEELFLLPGERGRRIRNGRKLRAGRQPSPMTGSCSWDTAASHVTNSSWRKGGAVQSLVITGRQSNTEQVDAVGIKQLGTWQTAAEGRGGSTVIDSLVIPRRQFTLGQVDVVGLKQPGTWKIAAGVQKYGHWSWTGDSPAPGKVVIVGIQKQLRERAVQVAVAGIQQQVTWSTAAGGGKYSH